MDKLYIPKIFRDLLGRRARYKVYHGGRGGGKSRAIAAALIHMASVTSLRILCAREIQLSIKDSVKRLLDDEIVRQGLQAEYTSTLTEIRNNRTGSLFIFSGLRGASADTIKSYEGIDICWLEEAHSISQRSWDVLIPTIRKEQSEIWISFNPYLKTDPVYKMFVEGTPPPDSVVVEVNHYDNPFFPDVLRREMEWDRERDPDKYTHVWLGKPVQNTDTQVFNGTWTIAPCPEPHPNEMLYFGADWGFAQDPTTLVRCWIDDSIRTLYVDHEAGGVGIEIDDTPALFDMVPGSRAYDIIADSARPETISYMRRAGFRVKPASKGKGSVEEGVARLKNYRIVVDPRCRNVVSELSLYSYKTDPRTGAILPVLEDRHNHTIDALRYATERLRGKRAMLQNATTYVIDAGSFL